MVFAYLPPTQSPYYDHTQNGYGVEIIEKCVLDICDNTEEFLLLMCGDFNARTGIRNGTRDAEDLDDVFCNRDCDKEPFLRRSNDTHVNTSGNQLIDLCDMYVCMILNGLTECGFDDSYTYMSQTGSSDIDYFIMSCDLFYSVCVDSLDVGSLIESDHMPVTLKMRISDVANVNMKVLRKNPKVINKIVCLR